MKLYPQTYRQIIRYNYISYYLLCWYRYCLYANFSCYWMWLESLVNTVFWPIVQWDILCRCRCNHQQNLIAPIMFCCSSMTWSRTLDKTHIWCVSLGSMCLRWQSVHNNACPFESSFTQFFMPSVNMTVVQSTCKYLEHLHMGTIWMSLMLGYHVSPVV